MILVSANMRAPAAGLVRQDTRGMVAIPGGGVGVAHSRLARLAVPMAAWRVRGKKLGGDGPQTAVREDPSPIVAIHVKDPSQALFITCLSAFVSSSAIANHSSEDYNIIKNDSKEFDPFMCGRCLLRAVCAVPRSPIVAPTLLPLLGNQTFLSINPVQYLK